MPLLRPLPPPAERVRGRGRLLMDELADAVEVDSGGGGTRVRLRFARPARAVAGLERALGLPDPEAT